MTGRRADLSKGLALAFLAGPWNARELIRRGRVALGQRPPWLSPLVRRVRARFEAEPLEEELIAFLADDLEVWRAARGPHPLRIRPPDEHRFDDNQRLRQPHLPQGASTSPALSNLAAWRLDVRLAALASSYGATMTRYADDLAFAGDRAFRRSLRFFLPQVGAIALEEGFRINHRKTRVMPRSRRQQLCGLVVNEKPNLPRREVDNLRALLFNAARFGPQSQNRERHPRFRAQLEGRIGHVASIHPARGQRLRALFERIRWDAAQPP
jgi:RNA-directed DNA polymerase